MAQKLHIFVSRRQLERLLEVLIAPLSGHRLHLTLITFIWNRMVRLGIDRSPLCLNVWLLSIVLQFLNIIRALLPIIPDQLVNAQSNRWRRRHIYCVLPLCSVSLPHFAYCGNAGVAMQPTAVYLSNFLPTSNPQTILYIKGTMQT